MTPRCKAEKRPNAIVAGPAAQAIDPFSTDGPGMAVEIRMARSARLHWAFVPSRLRETVSALPMGAWVHVGKQSSRTVVLSVAPADRKRAQP